MTKQNGYDGMNLLCRLFGHKWWHNSTAMCTHRCERCKTSGHFTNSYRTVESSEGYEKNVCALCGDYPETIKNGSPV